MIRVVENPWADDPETAARFRAAFRSAYATDEELAVMVRTAMRDLNHHHAPYAAALARCPGVVLAGQVNAGMVATVTGKGRAALRVAYQRLSLAATVPPGMDTNDLTDRLTGRVNPRLRHMEAQRLADADREDRAALAEQGATR